MLPGRRVSPDRRVHDPDRASRIRGCRPTAHAKVMAAAAKLGYRPNVAARSLRTDRTQSIAFISDVVASRAGARIVIARLDRQVDGIISRRCGHVKSSSGRRL